MINNNLVFKNIQYKENGNNLILCALMLYNTIIVLWPIIFCNVPVIMRQNVRVAVFFVVMTAFYAILRYGISLGMKSIIFPWFYLLLFAISYAVNEKANSEMNMPLYWLTTQSLPAYILLYNISDYKKLFNLLVKISYPVIVFYVIGYIMGEIFSLDIGHMVVSYAMLPFALFIIQDFFRKKSVYNIIFMIISLILIFVKGGRGTLLCALSLFFLNLLFSVNGKVRVGLILVFAIGVVGIYSQFYYTALDSISEYLQSKNIYSRTVDKLVEDEIDDDNGRSDFWGAAIEGIKESPVIGHGICGDRIYIGEALNREANYPHSIVLELGLQFGIFGLMFFVYIIIRIIRILRMEKNTYLRIFLLSLIPAALIKLFLSSTYIAEIPFFMLLAIIFSWKPKAIEKVISK